MAILYSTPENKKTALEMLERGEIVAVSDDGQFIKIVKAPKQEKPKKPTKEKKKTSKKSKSNKKEK